MRQLIEGARSMGLRPTPEQLAAFELYYQELVTWNRKFNLTAITEYEQVQVRHFLDSLSCLLADELRGAFTRPGARAIDVGSGAGFPGIPLKMICPSVQMTLLEATGKKIAFLEHLTQRLGLQTATVVHGRAEQVGHDASHRERYDVALARAVAELPVVVEYTLPFCSVGGWVVAQRGEDGTADACKAMHAIGLLGGELRRVVPVALPGLPEDRCLVVIYKVSPTPAAYPRRTGVPSKRPL